MLHRRPFLSPKPACFSDHNDTRGKLLLQAERSLGTGQPTSVEASPDYAG